MFHSSVAPQRWLVVAALACALAACSETGNAVVGGHVDAAVADADAAPPRDKPVAADAADAADAEDAADAADVTDATDVDDVTDATDVSDVADAADVMSGCSRDEDCASTPTTPACDTTTRRCVACVPSADRCARGTYCDSASNTCVAGCRADDDCMITVTGDAGVAPRHCDTASRACVECVTADQCGPGNLCVGNVCVPGCDATHACPTGQSCCGGACVDQQSNTAHCGRCDSRCSVPNATPACMNGSCAVGACTGTFANCDSDPTNGCEAATLSDVRNCGGCGMACAARSNSAVDCAAGRCVYTCNTGFADCDGDATNGCETDTRTSTASCGACGRSCAPANATAACVAGVCAVASCNAGFGDCDSNATNGCETNTRTTVSACGACGRACPAPSNTVPACVDGGCAVTCAAGFGECNGVSSDGCEIDLARTVTHCGSCGRTCVTANVATTECAGGACRIVSCDAGFADCDGNPANGCETDTRVSAMNCGTCGNACAAPGGTAVCRAGACGIASCATGRGDCDGLASNGCETDLTTSGTHCGTCGVACAPTNASGACVASACTVASCATGYADCDRAAGNGCEIDTRTSLSNCGACGTVCSFVNAAASCADGMCRLGACNASFGNCDSMAANGCEVDLRTSTANCGGCGAACAPSNATGACVAGACTVASCAAGAGDCDGMVANGCEVDVRTSNANCGMCGRACAVGQSCAAGTCTALASCAAIHTASPSAPSGVYAIDPDGDGGAAAFNVYCDMSSDGGGWTLILMAGTSPSGALGFDSPAWTDTSTLNPAVTDPAMNVSMKSAAFNTLGFTTMRLCLGAITSCLNEPVTVTSARALFGGAERLGARAVADFRTWGYAGNLGCNRIAFNVYDVGAGSAAASRARCRYGILMNNESTCEGSVDGGRGFGCRGYYTTQISAGQGDGIVGTSHERGWIFVR